MNCVLGVLSDLHCGSAVALAPPETKTHNGNVIGFGDNHHQAWLWEKWCEGINRVKEFVGESEFHLVVNGDATEGVHHRNEAELITALIESHVTMAKTCLTPYAKMAKKIFVVKGTECHTKDMETLLAERLGAVGGIAKDKWLIEINGILIDAAHHMTTTSRAHLEASAMSILMGNARINYARANQRIPQVFLRGHRHCGGVYTDDAGLFGVTSAWKMHDRFTYKVVTDSIPRPSILLLDFRNSKPGELPTEKQITFNPPQDEITIVGNDSESR